VLFWPRNFEEEREGREICPLIGQGLESVQGCGPYEERGFVKQFSGYTALFFEN
jgi:hypothetical protein